MNISGKILAVAVPVDLQKVVAGELVAGKSAPFVEALPFLGTALGWAAHFCALAIWLVRPSDC